MKKVKQASNQKKKQHTEHSSDGQLNENLKEESNITNYDRAWEDDRL